MSIELSAFNDSPPLTQADRELLRRELAREDLSCYTAVQLARKEVAFGHFDAACAFLRSEADKIRTHSKELYVLLCQ